ncbi:MAG: hypothetical protein R3Y65_05820 [Bacillota bacterium]
MLNTNTRYSMHKIMISVMIFLFALDFCDLGAIFLVGAFAVYLLYSISGEYKLVVNFDFLFLFALFSIYIIIAISNEYYIDNIAHILLYWIGPAISYFLGYNLLCKDINMKLDTLIWLLCSGFFIHGALNFFNTYYILGGTSRNIIDIWFNGILSATLQSIYFTMIMGMLFYAIFYEDSKIKKYILLIFIFIGIANALTTATRTPLYILVFVFCLSFTYYLILNSKKVKVVARFTMILLGFCFALYYAYYLDIFGLKTYSESSALFLRFNGFNDYSAVDDPRVERWTKTLIYMFDYPMGGLELRRLTDGYAHNLWLDVIHIAGIIPAVLLLMHSIGTCITFVKFIRSKKISEKTKFLFIGIFVSVMLNLCTEPILDGAPYLFLSMCMINGAAKRLVQIGEF